MGRLQLSWSAPVNGDRFLPFEQAAVHVFSAPARQQFPMRALERGVKATRSLLVVSIVPDGEGFNELLEVGG